MTEHHLGARTCLNCGEIYKPNSGFQKYCPDCRFKVKKEKTRLWGLANQERKKVDCREWRKANPEHQQRLNKEWHLANPGRTQELRQEWNSKNPERVLLHAKRHNAKHRTLGFNPLNSPFDGCDGHHINLNDVIHIPVAMHDSVKHNIWTGKNMAEINALAMGWLEQTGVNCARAS
jgi:predicted  nucleic acid-binding Zn-ribbon protein